VRESILGACGKQTVCGILPKEHTSSLKLTKVFFPAQDGFTSAVYINHLPCVVISGSAGRREEETDEEGQYYNKHIAPIIDRMTVEAKGKATFSFIDIQNFSICTLISVNYHRGRDKRLSGHLRPPLSSEGRACFTRW
jgi:hypothetical protein